MKYFDLSIISIIISVVSAIVAFCSYLVAKKALSIEKKREDRYSKSINYELIKGLHINSNADYIIYIFIVSISNSSSSNKSLSKVILTVNYTDKQDYNRKAFFPHNPSIAHEYGLKDYEFAPLNTYLNPHETITRGFIFKATKEIIKNNYVDVFQLVFEDNDSNSKTIDCILTTDYNIELMKG